MLYVPPAMESTVRGWVENAQEVDRLLEFISQQCLTQFLEEKPGKLRRSAAADAGAKKRRRKPP